MAIRIESGPSLRAAPVAVASRAPTVPGGFRTPTFKSNFSLNTAANFLARPTPKFETRTPNIANIKFSGPFNEGQAFLLRNEFRKPTFSPRETKPQIKVWNPFNVPNKTETLSRRVSTLNGTSGGRVEIQTNRQAASKMIWIGRSKEAATKTFIKPEVRINPNKFKNEALVIPPKRSRGSTTEVVQYSNPQIIKTSVRILRPEDIRVFERVNRILEKGNTVKIIRPSLEKPVVASKKEKVSPRVTQSLVEQALSVVLRRNLILERLKRALEKVEQKSAIKDKVVKKLEVKAQTVASVTQQVEEEVFQKTQETNKTAPKAEVKPEEKIVEFQMPKDNQKPVIKTEVSPQTQLENTVEALSSTGASTEIVAEAIVESLVAQRVDESVKSELVTKIQTVLEEYEVVRQQTKKQLEEKVTKELKSEIESTYIVQDKKAQSERYGVVGKILNWMRSQGFVQNGQVDGGILAKNLPDQKSVPTIVSGLVKNTPVTDGSWEYAKAEFSESSFKEAEAAEVVSKVLEGNSAVVHVKDKNEARLAHEEEVKKVLNGHSQPRIMVETERIIEIREKKLREVVRTIQEQMPQLVAQVTPQLGIVN